MLRRVVPAPGGGRAVTRPAVGGRDDRPGPTTPACGIGGIAAGRDVAALARSCRWPVRDPSVRPASPSPLHAADRHPPPPVRPAPIAPPPADRGRTMLARVLAADPLLPSVVPAVLPVMPGRPAAEHDAVCRAAGCPDLFAVHAPDTVVRERLLAEVARLAVRKGERVLILTPDPAAADRLAVTLNDHLPDAVVRATGPDDHGPRRSPAVVKLTLAGRFRAKADHLRRELASALTTAETKRTAAVGPLPILQQLSLLAARFDQLAAGVADLDAARPDIALAVRAEADGQPVSTAFTDAVRELRTVRSTVLNRLTAERDAATATRTEKAAHLAEARQHWNELQAGHGRKPGFFSRLIGKPKTAEAEPVDLDALVTSLDAEVAGLSARESQLTADLTAAGEAHTATVAARLAAETAAREADADARRTALADEQNRVRAEFHAHGKQGLNPFGLSLPPLSAAGVATAVAYMHATAAAAEQAAADARRKLADLDTAPPEVPPPAHCRVVVGTPASLHADPVFAVPAADPPFGVLLLDHAEELPEPEFGRLAALAGRWVLAGDAGLPGLFARLVRAGDADVWAIDGGHLVCRLARPTPAEWRTVTREAVVDAPDVELRTVVRNGSAVLAEMAFPPVTSPADARRFVAANLGEAFPRPCGPGQWAADGMSVCWPAAEHPQAVVIDLESGVRERVSPGRAGGFTAKLEFDPAAGWTPETAREWVAARCPAETPGRAAVLSR